MNRRDFLRRSSLIAAGVVAADQLEILERVGRRVFPGFGAGVRTLSPGITSAQWDAVLRENYGRPCIEAMLSVESPFKAKLEGRKLRGAVYREPSHSLEIRVSPEVTADFRRLWRG